MSTNEKTLNGMCESCMMPFKKDPKGTDREHEKYCSYCYSGGKLAYPGNDVKEFKRAMYDVIITRGESKLKAKFFTHMAGYAPRWKNK